MTSSALVRSYRRDAEPPPPHNAAPSDEAPFTIRSNGPGAFGSGPLVQMPGNVLVGSEGHGLIQFVGTFSSISWTGTNPEFWSGFTWGVNTGAWLPGALTYCTGAPNSAGPGSQSWFAGSLSVSANAFHLTTAGGIPNGVHMYYYGGTSTSVPFGDGMRCVAAGPGGLQRLGPPLVSSSTGTSTRQVDFLAAPASAGPGQITAGTTRYFQDWYRDIAGPGGTGFNLSNGLRVTFSP